MTPCFAKLAYSRASLALSPRCRARSARAVRPASLAASARYSLCRQSPVKVSAIRLGLGMPREQDRWLRPCKFGRSGSVSRQFTQFPVSQRLKPQSSMPERFCTSPFASAAQRICRSLGSQGRCTSSRVSSSKQERVGSQQPPNPSFKRTRLRRSA
jgi:hypothetical protein